MVKNDQLLGIKQNDAQGLTAQLCTDHGLPAAVPYLGSTCVTGFGLEQGIGYGRNLLPYSSDIRNLDTIDIYNADKAMQFMRAFATDWNETDTWRRQRCLHVMGYDNRLYFVPLYLEGGSAGGLPDNYNVGRLNFILDNNLHWHYRTLDTWTNFLGPDIWERQNGSNIGIFNVKLRCEVNNLGQLNFYMDFPNDPVKIVKEFYNSMGSGANSDGGDFRIGVNYVITVDGTNYYYKTTFKASDYHSDMAPGSFMWSFITGVRVTNSCYIRSYLTSFVIEQWSAQHQVWRTILAKNISSNTTNNDVTGYYTIGTSGTIYLSNPTLYSYKLVFQDNN